MNVGHKKTCSEKYSRNVCRQVFSVCQSETSYEHTACPVQQYTLCGTDPNALLLLQNSNMHSVSIRDNITLPSAERCSENNFRIISRKSKESSVAGRKTKREKHEIKINIVQSQNIKQELGKNKTKKKNIVLFIRCYRKKGSWIKSCWYHGVTLQVLQVCSFQV